MKTARYSDAQIMDILKQAERGVPVSELCREHGMSNARFYKWCAKFGSMDVNDVGAEGHGRGKPSPEADVCRDEHAK